MLYVSKKFWALCVEERKNMEKALLYKSSLHMLLQMIKCKDFKRINKDVETKNSVKLLENNKKQIFGKCKN